MAGPAPSDAVPYTITELTGQQRTIRLVGRALPYRPIRFSEEQRAEVDWPAGVPEGVITTTGSKRNPTTVNGKWKDKYLGATADNAFSNPLQPATVDSAAVTSAKELVAVFISVCAEGQLVEVQWAHLIRRGILSTFDHEWDNVHDVAWSCTFTWNSDGSKLGPAAFEQSTTSADAASKFQKQRDDLVKAVGSSDKRASGQPFDLPFSPSFVLTLFNLVETVSTSVDQAMNVSAGLAQQSTSPEEAARRTTAVANGLIAQTTDIIDRLDAQPARTQVVGLAPSSRPGLVAVSTIAIEAYSRDVRSKAKIIRDTAIEVAATLGVSLSPALLATYRPRNGEDLRDVSRIFYGTSFEWQRLLQFNILDSSLCTAGQTILVPKLDGASTVRQ